MIVRMMTTTTMLSEFGEGKEAQQWREKRASQTLESCGSHSIPTCSGKDSKKQKQCASEEEKLRDRRPYIQLQVHIPMHAYRNSGEEEKKARALELSCEENGQI
jgi:hypothetical protein